MSLYPYLCTLLGGYKRERRSIIAVLAIGSPSGETFTGISFQIPTNLSSESVINISLTIFVSVSYLHPQSVRT